MAPIVLEGETLGEKRRSYNKLVNDTILHNPLNSISKINYEEPDIDNLFKIDIASRNKDVNYILEVFKCEDMLYVSRALKQSRWLIEDNEFAHIINPTYLNDHLFPQMTVKAKNKLILQIRLHLKEETRVEVFCNYIMLQDLQSGLKWLPHCSVLFIERCIVKYANDIPAPLMKRLCRQSFTFFEIYLDNCYSYKKFDILNSPFLIRKNTEKYLQITGTTVTLGPKPTQIIMNKCPNKILDNLENYIHLVNIRTLSKFIKKEEIKDFVLKIMKIKTYRVGIDNMQHFLKRLPKEDFPFVKQIFIDKTYNEMERVEYSQDQMLCSKSFSGREHVNTSVNIYRWYKFASFNTSFKDLKKLIRIESNPNERNAILTVMLYSAGKNIEHINSIVQYYHENHINEPFIFKYHFVSNILSKHVLIYDKKSWEYLNDIFTSMEVYEESNNNVQSCVKAIILYSVIHDEAVPKIIEQKFVFETFKSYQKSLQKDDKDKVFNYLYKLETGKLECQMVKKETNFDIILALLKNILNLLIDWKKELSEYPLIIEHIKHLALNKQKEDLSVLYNMKKSWRKLLFQESILLSPTPDVCINVIKHGPQLINTYKNEISIICSVNTMGVKIFLNKVRIFWGQSLADFFKSIYLNKFESKVDHSSAIFGLSILLPQKQYLELVHQYVPIEAKIDWRNQQDTSFSLSRNIAKKMHLARPQVPLSTVLLYAKGSSLQYAMPSLNAILYNLSCYQTQNQLKDLLDTPVSLQKHGIRIATSKLKRENLKQILSSLWNSTKNSSIRAALMKQTFNLLCEQNSTDVIEEMWDIFNTFIDNLTTEENKTIYSILSRVDQVPLTIKVKFGLKSYQFLKSLPEKSNCSSLIYDLKIKMRDFIQLFDINSVAEIFLNSILDNLAVEVSADISYIAKYLLSAENEEAQNARFDKILMPILVKAFDNWYYRTDDEFYARSNLKRLLDDMYLLFEEFILNREIHVPVILFNNIFTKLYTSIPKAENYTLITISKLAATYVKILNDILVIKKHDAFNVRTGPNKKFKWQPLYLEAAPAFGKICLEYLKNDIKEYFPSIYLLFADALNSVSIIFQNNTVSTFRLLEELLECEDGIEGNLLVLQLLSQRYHSEDKEISLKAQIFKKISNNPSKEVQVHYWRYQQ